MNPVRKETTHNNAASRNISNGVKVLMISGDKHIVTPGTEAERRFSLQRSQVSRLDAFVWPHVHSWWAVVTAVRHNLYDVVTAQDPFWRGLFAWIVARARGMSLNLQVHADLGAQPFVKRTLAHVLLRKADSVRVVSDGIRAQVQKTGTKAKLHVLPVYVDLDRFQNLERIAHDRPMILWVGRFESEKDPLAALKVLKEVREHGVDATLIMLGAGKLESTLRKAAKDLPVEFPGWKPPEEYLKVADVVLCTSLHESWGASIIEALAAGVPVVAPDVGIAKEAGAIVVKRPDLASAVVHVLLEKPVGRLQLNFLDKEEWAKRWRETLV